MVTPVDHHSGHTDDGVEVHGTAVDDAVQVLHERLDVLLDRLTDTVLRAPSPGSDRWRTRLQDPDASAALSERSAAAPYVR